MLISPDVIQLTDQVEPEMRGFTGTEALSSPGAKKQVPAAPGAANW